MKGIDHPRHTRLPAWGRRPLATLLILALTCPPATAMQLATDDDVERGCRSYMQAQFDEAISTLEKSLLQRDLTGDRLLQARICLARAYVKRGAIAQAQETFLQILRQDPTWRADPIEIPPDEVAVFEDALREFRSERPGSPAPAAEPAPGARPATRVAPPKPTVRTPPPMRAEGKKFYQKWWVWGLALGAGVGAALALGGGGGGGGGDELLPGFPPPPSP